MKPAIEYRASEAIKAFLKTKEDLVLTAYPDPKTGGAPWTVGYGATGPGIQKGTVWTRERAEARFEDDVAERERIVWLHVKVPLTQGQFDALLSIIYNVGAGSPTRDGIIRLRSGKPSTLLRKLNAGDYAGAREEFFKWVSPGSNVERGLKIRRREEVENFWDINHD
jgi:lysozyme